MLIVFLGGFVLTGAIICGLLWLYRRIRKNSEV